MTSIPDAPAKGNKARRCLYIFDLDGTLIESFIGDNTPSHPFDEVTILPGRIERINAIRTSGNIVALATNQGGAAFGYQSEGQIMMKIKRTLVEFGFPPKSPVPVAVCFSHPKSNNPTYNDPRKCARRKPSPLMLIEIISKCPDVDGVLFVGDRIEDRESAQHAGIEFDWASPFFESKAIRIPRKRPDMTRLSEIRTAWYTDYLKSFSTKVARSNPEG